MKCVLLINSCEKDDANMSEADMGKLIQDYGTFAQALSESGQVVIGERLHPTTDATTVRVRNGDTVTTDGPYCETKEQMGGFYIIDVPDLDSAIQWAARIPSAKMGSVEIRPVWEHDG